MSEKKDTEKLTEEEIKIIEENKKEIKREVKEYIYKQNHESVPTPLHLNAEGSFDG